MGNKEIKVKGKKVFCFVFSVFVTINTFAQVAVTAKEELLIRIPLGTKESEASYIVNEEGMWTPGAPEIDNEGNIYLFSHSNRNILRYSKGRLETLKYPTDYPMQYIINPNEYPVVSQEGEYGYDWHDYQLEENLQRSITLDKIAQTVLYMMPWGQAIQYSDYDGNSQIIGIKYDPMIFSMEKKVNRSYTGYTVADLKTWLQTQPGEFRIGEDGLLYKNGMVWSAVKPLDASHGWDYCGKLASGHSDWRGGGRSYAPGEFLITDSEGKTELKMTVPWMVQPGEDASEEKKEYLYDYGLGPWGELYCLLPPDFKITGGSKDGEGGYMPIFGPDPNGTAELVVVRNHLKYFGRLNDDKVRLRKGPSTSTESLGTYPVKTGFRILEKGTKEETIGGQKSVWYKVRLLDGTEGWFFGAFVHNLYDGPNGNPPPWPNVADW